MTTTLTRSESISDVLARIDDMYPLLQLEADDSERLRRPTPAVQSALRDSGVFGLMVPAELGGLDATPLQVMAVIEKLSHADASLGWLVRTVAGETATAAAYLGDTAVDELFGDGRCALVAGQSAGYSGYAVAVDGGYQVTGTWKFAPGVSMATHLNLAVTDADTGAEIVCVVPRSALRIIDNWDMLGLRATASLDYAADDVFVADDYTFDIGRDTIRRGGVTNRLSPALLAGLGQASWSQGVGRRMLDELRELAQRKSDSPDSPVTTAEFFSEFARHYSHVRGTMALLRETSSEHEAALMSGAALSTDQETMTRLASNLATRTALEISQLVHRFAGAQVMRNSALQRFFRDSHAGTQHRGTSHIVTEQCGRVLTGTLPADTHWGFFDLVVPNDSRELTEGQPS
ncbi:acyl-CoA dehydrogenase family protein [Gordonia sp. CPCC 205515]|uniref:acyl-CoA dehydrogenase family protein n=1 Tax=Gordonia sp. CPCC 205515 TaxID=3140791 RepID=UPI003AF3E990